MLPTISQAKILARIHHKFLVSMIGYCKDGNCAALVYEYMSEGTLDEHIQGNLAPFTWRQRIRIAMESAQGLEYLHKGCNPPLIHRDVKMNNILLNANLEAKIADFGLSKALPSDSQSHITTLVAGTHGYLDPEYHMTSQLTEKSDVYSFGVVLLEQITGQKAIIRALNQGSENTHIVQWVRKRLVRGNIESVVDARMQGDYDLNSVWKVADLALKCTMPCGSQRPTMPEVVIKLKECMELEVSGEPMKVYPSYYTSQNSRNGTVRSGNYHTANSGNGPARSTIYYTAMSNAS
ncbi:Leucine-rich repeat protein kinase family protein [Rhynchospora pubera]|uniref:Leucine-rich repeat protein kinase family protein n=1 Tax=Rhynchospora pubera TaxID=906938 RepID=A0AAV8HXP1_9POAL|nr:Leucine-rich repeat protein kinase family protein [Rhynchospora pubera]